MENEALKLGYVQLESAAPGHLCWVSMSRTHNGRSGYDLPLLFSPHSGLSVCYSRVDLSCRRSHDDHFYTSSKRELLVVFGPAYDAESPYRQKVEQMLQQDRDTGKLVGMSSAELASMFCGLQPTHRQVLRIKPEVIQVIENEFNSQRYAGRMRPSGQ